jgi:protein SCO1/2
MDVLKKPLLVAASAGLFAGVVSAVMFGPMRGPAPDAPPAATGKALIGGPFSLVDQTGKRVTEKDFAGRPMLVYFGYTSCPDVCPSGLQVISAALDRLGPKAANLAPLFITLDPERDTAEVLGPYLKSFHPRLVGLTGSGEEVAAAAKAYRVYFSKEADEKNPASYTIDHSSYMYLMDGSGAYVAHFPHTVGVDELAAALAKAL